VVTASVTDIQPVCSDCVYKPYCGVCPVFNYSEHNDLFMYSRNFRCKVHSGILDYLFLKQQDNRVKKLFMKWLKQG